MSRKPHVACDVDGVVLGLVDGLQLWMNETYGVFFDKSKVIYHNDMGRSPELMWPDMQLRNFFPQAEERQGAAFSMAFEAFMKERDVYSRIPVIEGALEGMGKLMAGAEVVFVTALMKSARDHFRSKMESLERWFPNVPIVTCPSGLKYRYKADWAIDDRFDTCMRWAKDGAVASIVFDQPWSEYKTVGIGKPHSWEDIPDIILGDYE